MKRNKLATACLTLTMLIGCLTACSGTGNSAAESTAPTPEEVTAAAPAPVSTAEAEDSQTEPDSAVPEEAAPEAGVPNPDAKASELASYTAEGYDLPLFDDTLELSYWIPIEHDLANLVSSYADMESYQWIQDNLGVSIDWNQCSVEAKSDQFNLMVAGGDYCDLIDGVFELYAGGDDAAIEDDVILSLDDCIYDYMPFYTSYFVNDDLRKAVLTDAGHYGSIYQMRAEKSASLTNGPVVRLDWLEECGLPYDRDNLPKTIDDWHEILTAFHDKYVAVTIWDPTGVEWLLL